MNKEIIISGGTGLIGSRIVEILDPSIYNIRILSRSKKKPHGNVTYFQWDPIAGKLDEAVFDGADAMITLAGAGIADKRWTAARKKLIIDSRVMGNELLSNSMKRLEVKLSSIVSASAIGYYGDRQDEVLHETSDPGQEGFLSESTTLWEKSMDGFKSQTDRFSLIRVGIVLSTKGGALQKMMIPLRFGVSGYFGNGKQYYSWIHIDDICRMLIEGVQNTAWSGTYNGVSPQPISLRKMAKEIRKTFVPFGIALPVPAFLLRLAMGEMTNMLTNSTKVVPTNAINEGFEFDFEDVKEAVLDLKRRKI